MSGGQARTAIAPEEDAGGEGNHSAHGGPSLSGAAHRAWSVGEWPCPRQSMTPVVTSFLRHSIGTGGPGVQASLGRGYPQHTGRNSSFNRDLERSHGCAQWKGPLEPRQPLLLWDTGFVQRSKGDVGEQVCGGPGDGRKRSGQTYGDTVQRAGVVPRGRGACPEAATLPVGPLGTSLSLQHSCLDGREDRPAVPLANTQARKSYQKATSLQK